MIEVWGLVTLEGTDIVIGVLLPASRPLAPVQHFHPGRRRRCCFHSHTYASRRSPQLPTLPALRAWLFCSSPISPVLSRLSSRGGEATEGAAAGEVEVQVHLRPPRLHTLLVLPFIQLLQQCANSHPGSLRHTQLAATHCTPSTAPASAYLEVQTGPGSCRLHHSNCPAPSSSTIPPTAPSSIGEAHRSLPLPSSPHPLLHFGCYTHP